MSGFFIFYQNQLKVKSVNSFDDCAKYYPVMESYPAQCNTPDGRHFVQQLSEGEKEKLKPVLNNSVAPDEASSCVTDKVNKNKTDYAKGEILAGFRTSSLEESKKLVVSYGLNYEVMYSSEALNVLNIKVVPGEEFKWMCILEKNPDIKYAELNAITKLEDCSKGPC